MTTDATGTGPGSSTSTGKSTAQDPRAAVPAVKPAKIGNISYAKASADRVKLFAPVAKAAGGLTTSESVTTVKVDGRDAGAVAVYSLKPGHAKSATFQDQYVVQLLNAVSHAKSEPKFVRVGNQVMALSTGSKAVAGWVSGDHVMLLYREGGKPDLASLAAAVKAQPVMG